MLRGGIIIYNSNAEEEAEMIENQIPQEQTPTASSNKWIWWVFGGGCVLLLCVAAIVIVAVILYFVPVTTG